jgi:hypothetical protein
MAVLVHQAVLSSLTTWWSYLPGGVGLSDNIIEPVYQVVLASLTTWWSYLPGGAGLPNNIVDLVYRWCWLL